MAIIIVVLLYTIVISTNAGTLPTKSNIIDDTRILSKEITSVVLFNELGTFFCTGSLISNRHVISTAQCIDILLKKKVKNFTGFTIVVGTIDKFWGGTYHTIKRAETHKDYIQNKNVGIPVADIGVLVLKEKVNFAEEGASMLEIEPNTYEPFTKAEAIVWSSSHIPNNRVSLAQSNILLSVPVFIIDNKYCSKIYHPLSIFPTQICGVSPYRHSCFMKEDIGGPLVYNGYLIGLISYGFANETKNPGIFTRITSFTDFINGAMMRGKKMKCNKSRFYL